MKKKVHEIIQDANLHPKLRAEVGELRGAMVEASEKVPLPKRFKVLPMLSSPSMVIVDKLTKRSTQVPLYAYGAVRKVLAELFKD